MGELTDKLTRLATDTLEAVTASEGETEKTLRADIEAQVRGRATSLDPVLAKMVDQVKNDPANTDLEALKSAGYTDDQVFELILVAATTEGIIRMERGLAPLSDAAASKPEPEQARADG